MLRSISLILLLLLIGCDSGSNDAEPEQDHVGTYDLHAVDGATLPASIGPDPDDLLEQNIDTFLSGTATLRLNESFDLALTVSTNGNEAQTFTISGTYTLNGQNISYSYASGDGEVDSGRLNGETLTLISGGITFSFLKQ